MKKINGAWGSPQRNSVDAPESIYEWFSSCCQHQTVLRSIVAIYSLLNLISWAIESDYRERTGFDSRRGKFPFALQRRAATTFSLAYLLPPPFLCVILFCFSKQHRITTEGPSCSIEVQKAPLCWDIDANLRTLPWYSYLRTSAGPEVKHNTETKKQLVRRKRRNGEGFSILCFFIEFVEFHCNQLSKYSTTLKKDRDRSWGPVCFNSIWFFGFQFTLLSSSTTFKSFVAHILSPNSDLHPFWICRLLINV